MHEGWRETTLGEVVHQVRRPIRVVPGETYNLLGVRWYGNGPFLREVGVGGTIKATQLYAVQRGDFIYNRLFAWKGSFGIVDDSLHGSFVSGEFPLFATEASLLSVDYLNLVMCRPTVWSVIEKQSTGSTTTSRNRWKEERFLEWDVHLPPLVEQRRIVDLIAAVDAAIEAAKREERSLQDITVLILGDLYDQMVGPRIPVRDLSQLIVGGSWGKPPGVDECEVIALGTSAYSGDSVWVDRHTGTLRSLSAKKRDSRSLRSGDIVLERSGGSEDQPVGRVIWVPDSLVGHIVPSDFMRLVRIDPAKALPAYVFWVMWLRYKRGETVHFQTKSTNIRNLRIPEYLATPIAVPSFQDQHRFVDIAQSFLSNRGSVAGVIDAQTSVRSALLADLLSGDHEIPESYDELLSA